jgi:hypothetical protein
VGPILIFDKSALQALRLREAVLLNTLFLTNITPLFYVESLADLEKQDDPTGRPPEEVVADLAAKTPVMHNQANVFHRTLLIDELVTGRRVDMSRRANLSGGRAKRAPDGTLGVLLKDAPEAAMLARWRARTFSTSERRQAQVWRAALAAVDLDSRIELARRLVPPAERVATLEQAKAFADGFVRRPDQAVLSLALEMLEIPQAHRGAILARHASARFPSLHAFAPYAAYIMTVDLVLYLGMGLDQIQRDRASHIVDIAYLYYLPFCMVFTSTDRLHRQLTPLFADLGQAFLWGPELKAGLAELLAYCEAHPNELRAKGLIGFLSKPPEGMANSITALWDQFLPSWRTSDDASPPSPPPPEDELMRRIKHMTETNDTLEEGAWTDEPDFVVMQSTIPVEQGGIRLVPEGIEHRQGSSAPNE